MIELRNSIKAIIIEDGRLLAMHNRNAEEGDYYILPGGGQHPGETFTEALRRECLEELGAEVAVGELVLVREFIGTNHTFARRYAHLHQIEVMFRCALLTAPNPIATTKMDDEQQGYAWLPLGELAAYNLYPHALVGCLGAGGSIAGPLYMGDAD